MYVADPRRPGETTLRGIGVSPGVAIGPAYLMLDTGFHAAERRIAEGQAGEEIVRLEDALIETRQQIKAIQANLDSNSAGGKASILDAHLMVLDDRAFIEEVINTIRRDLVNAEGGVRKTAERYVDILAGVEDDYVRERVADVRDVARRIMRNLSGRGTDLLEQLRHKHIIIAYDLAPSDTASLRKDMAIAFATDMGSPTSHTAVMARALEIPAVVALHDISRRVRTGDEVLIDGNRGVVIVNPTSEHLTEYGKMAEARRTISEGLTASLRHAPAETRDGRRVTLSANLEQEEELGAVLQYGAEGVGLFRSEYLFLSKNALIGEDEQAAAYGRVASRLAPAPVIIRTLDIGGDKLMRDADGTREANPFLGCRSIRLSLRHVDVFKTQLRAILRASTRRNVKIMYPMISNVGEVQRANEILEETKGEMRAEGLDFDPAVEVGVMIETPAAALTSDCIAAHVKFFSLGTNDLIQYTIAVDRVNERVAYLYEPTHPAVLRLIRHTVEAGHAQGIWVGLCGEMAADPLMTPLLLGMGLDEFSVAPSAVPLVKDAVRAVTFAQAQALARTALTCRTAAEVLGHCRDLTREVAPEILELV